MERLIDAEKLKAEFIGKRYGTQAIKYVIDQQPTVDPVKHGHWIMKPNGYGTCSNCKMCSLDIGGGVDSDYCPNCGAKMTLD